MPARAGASNVSGPSSSRGHGAPTARPNTCARPESRPPEPRFLAVWNQSLVLGCDWIEARQLYHVIRDPKWREKVPNLAEELSGLLRKLDRGGITHGDLHPQNILIDQHGKSWLVDLDAVRVHHSRTFFLRKRSRDEHRLARELEIEPRLLAALGFRREGNRWTL